MDMSPPSPGSRCVAEALWPAEVQERFEGLLAVIRADNPAFVVTPQTRGLAWGTGRARVGRGRTRRCAKRADNDLTSKGLNAAVAGSARGKEWDPGVHLSLHFRMSVHTQTRACVSYVCAHSV